jgi:hypothetical protein
MIWRWVIRGVCVALLVGCVAAWVASYWRQVGVYDSVGWGYQNVALPRGKLMFIRWAPTRMIELRGHVYFDPPSEPWNNGPVRWRFLGFSYDGDFSDGKEWWLCVPLWFPTVVAGGLLWVVWRKTRGRRAGGFPVEVDDEKLRERTED